MSTHTLRSGPVIRCSYRCRSTAVGREACKGAIISAYEIETAVLSEMGDGPELSTKEQEGVVREAARSIIYDAASGRVRIELIKPGDDERPALSGGKIQRGDLE
jgi:hypothetical protein